MAPKNQDNSDDQIPTQDQTSEPVETSVDQEEKESEVSDSVESLETEDDPVLDAERQERLDLEIQEVIRNERAANIRMTIAFSAGIIAVFVIGFILFTQVDSFLAKPFELTDNAPVEASATNDPVCRKMIENVEELGHQYKSFAMALPDLTKSDDLEKLSEIRSRFDEFRQSLDEIEKDSLAANLRFDSSRSDLNQWFGYVDNEWSILQDLAIWRSEKLDSQKAAADKDQETQKSADQDDIILLKSKPPKKKERVGSYRIETAKKSPEELFQGARLASLDAFEAFRVWHSGGPHPCGASRDDAELAPKADATPQTP